MKKRNSIRLVANEHVMKFTLNDEFLALIRMYKIEGHIRGNIEGYLDEVRQQKGMWKLRMVEL